MSQTRHSSSYNSCDHGILLSKHEFEIGDSRGDGARSVSTSQDISHSSFHNFVETVDGDRRIGYMSQTSTYPSHHSGNHIISPGVIVMVM